MIAVGINNLVKSKLCKTVHNKLEVILLQPLSTFLGKKEKQRNNQ